MHKRKIQLIAGMTYSISLPKEWVKKNNLKEKNEVTLFEKNDRELVISPHSVESRSINEISLNVDEHVNDIDQIIFAVYYIGIENIHIFSKKELTKEVKSRIRKSLSHMSGTEIIYEDKNKITIRVLLDKSRVNIMQLFYRLQLIIESSISNIVDKPNINEIRINENEIDRLYNLISKIISLSLVDSNVLHSSKIRNVSLLPAYFMIGKKLENIGDSINDMAEYMHKNKVTIEKKSDIDFIKFEINRSVNQMTSNQSKIFKKILDKDVEAIHNNISKIKDKIIVGYMEDIVRYIIDIQEEIVNISFYNKMIDENLI